MANRRSINSKTLPKRVYSMGKTWCRSNRLLGISPIEIRFCPYEAVPIALQSERANDTPVPSFSTKNPPAVAPSLRDIVPQHGPRGDASPPRLSWISTCFAARSSTESMLTRAQAMASALGTCIKWIAFSRARRTSYEADYPITHPERGAVVAWSRVRVPGLTRCEAPVTGLPRVCRPAATSRSLRRRRYAHVPVHLCLPPRLFGGARRRQNLGF